MSKKELLKSRAVFPIGTVIKLTGLTARQIRYYESQGFFITGRSSGNHRLYSLNDVDLIMDINDGLQAGYDLASLKKQFNKATTESKKVIHWEESEISDNQVRSIFEDEILAQSGMHQTKPF